jgi:hypothetical protein
MTRFARTVLALSLVVAAPLALAACGATDSVKDVKEAADIAGEGLAVAGYLDSVNQQQQAYGRIVSSQTLTTPHNAAQGKKFEQAQTDLNKIAKELQGVKPDKKFAKAHKDLIASVKQTSAAAGKLAEAANAGDDKAFNAATEDWSKATGAFAETFDTLTKDLQKSMDAASDGPG